MSEPRYLSGDEFALNGGYEELVNCKECKAEFDQVEYRSDTCSECEDKRVMREKESK
jgi:DNA-directed RNA polymerase subunit RPC12/RpoP